MGAFPDLVVPSGPTITPWSVLESLGSGLNLLQLELGSTASSAWPSANLAIYIPFVLPQRATLAQLFTNNGATASDNFDVGIYSERGDRLVSKGSTAQAGTSVIQAFDVTDTVIGPGLFHLAIACDGTTGTLLRVAATADSLRAMGVMQQASAFPLPATATFATMAQAYLPVVGALFNRAVI